MNLILAKWNNIRRNVLVWLKSMTNKYYNTGVLAPVGARINRCSIGGMQHIFTCIHDDVMMVMMY